MKYKVVVRFKRVSEGLKEYKVGQEIELTKSDYNKLKDYVKPIKQNKKAPITKKGAIKTK